MQDKKHIYVLKIKNTSEIDPHSYEATKAVAKKIQNPRKLTCIHIYVPQNLLMGDDILILF